MRDAFPDMSLGSAHSGSFPDVLARVQRSELGARAVPLTAGLENDPMTIYQVLAAHDGAAVSGVFHGMFPALNEKKPPRTPG